jgi:DNA modification methylase
LTDVLLYKGDCLEEMKKIPDGSVDLVLTDPPYGTTACKWDTVIPFEPMWEQLNRIIKDKGAIVLFGSEPFSSALRMSNIRRYKYDWIWDRDRPFGVFLAKIQPLRTYENISVFNAGYYYPIMRDARPDRIRPLSKANKEGSKNNIAGCDNCTVASDYDPTKRYPENIIRISSYSKECNSSRRLHPAQKPVALLEYLIRTYTQPGETVLDFTMGSGSTGVACVNTGRKFIGIELDEHYFGIAQERISNAQTTPLERAVIQ